MGHLTQMLGLAVQNFVSAAVGMAVVVGLIRGITRAGTRPHLGNFWVDLTRTVTRILLPLSFVFALVLVSQGAIQNFKGGASATTLDGTTEISEQFIPGGPVASQEAIKQLGTNGGGSFNANSAHPFENPNAITNVLEIFGLLLIPFAFVVAFGHLVKDKRQAKLLIAAMAGILVVMRVDRDVRRTERQPRAQPVRRRPVDLGRPIRRQHGRQGDSLRRILLRCVRGGDDRYVDRRRELHARLVHADRRRRPMISMMLGEVSPGGVGVGLMGMLIYALLAVFIAGLMVGRTPEYLGKKIQAAEMKLLTLYILAMPIALLSFAGASVLLKSAFTLPGRSARPVGDPLQLRLGREQQRLGVRLPGHEHRLVHDHPGHRDAHRPVLPDHPGARDRRFARRQAEGPRDRRNAAHAQPLVRRAPRRRHRHRRRPDLLPGPRAWAPSSST